MDARKPAGADVVIIGGGVMGTSAAYHLAHRGASVTLLEPEPMFGTGSTALNAGGFRHQFSTAVNIELSKLSLALLMRFEEEFEHLRYALRDLATFGLRSD